MKIYKIANKSLTIGNVGSFESANDTNRIYMVSDWLANKDQEYAKDITNFSHDNIDLNRGRDFLKEGKTYDIVILHDIFNPSDAVDSKKQGIFSTSPHHRSEIWVSRLASTGADYIFVFGSWTEVGGWWLGEIPGYDMIKGRSEYQTVYRSKSLPPVEIESDKPIDWDKVDTTWLEKLEMPQI